MFISRAKLGRIISRLEKLERGESIRNKAKQEQKQEEYLLNRGWEGVAEEREVSQTMSSLFGSITYATEIVTFWWWYPPKNVTGLRAKRYTLEEALRVDKELS